MKEFDLDTLAKEFCEKELFCDEYGEPYIEIHPDYRDEIEESDAQKIIDAEDPAQYLSESLDTWWFDAAIYEENQFFDQFKRHIEGKFEEEDDYELPDDYELEDILRSHYYIKYPEDWALKQEFPVIIRIDNGDANYDFAVNENIIDEDGDLTPDGEKAALVWLAEQQGYPLKKLLGALRKGDCRDPQGFLESVRVEVANGYGIEALVFLATMTLGDLIELKTKMKENPNGSFTLGKNVECGLFDAWNGGGSVLEIRPEKDVVVPFEKVHRVWIDTGRGYNSVRDVYGTDTSIFRDVYKG